MTRTPVHPLQTYLLERGVGIAEGARLLSVSERRLRDVLRWRSRLLWWREAEIAADLGTATEVLFPPPENKGDDRT